MKPQGAAQSKGVGKMTKAQREWLSYVNSEQGRVFAGGVPVVVRRLIKRRLAAVWHISFAYTRVAITDAGRAALKAGEK